MRCDHARAAVSAAADGALATAEREPLRGHLATCPDCSRFAAEVTAVRRQLRFEAVDEVPDVAPAVLAAVRGQRPAGTSPRRHLLQAAAVFLAAVLAGAAFVGLDPNRPPQVAAAPLPERVVVAQHEVRTYTATLEIVERGWHPQVDERRFRGTLRYEAPESFALHLDDVTSYPSSEWPPNDVDVVVRDDYQWQRATPACPSLAVPACLPDQPRVRAVTRRVPFDQSSPAALDLVVPVDSFALAAAPADLLRAEIDDRDAIGVDVTVAQVRPLLAGLLAAGNWRGLHPEDAVRLWLDAELLVPLRLEVRAAGGQDRALWASRRGHDDRSGQVVLAVAFTDVVVNGPVAEAEFAAVPPTARMRDAGFVDGADVSDAPVPSWLPAALQPHRSGVIAAAGGPPVAVRAYSGGRAWLTVQATDRWPGGRLFGDIGEVVRIVHLGPAGIAYVSEDASRVALHTGDLDVAVTGSVPEADLLAVAAGLGVTGEPVPVDWAEAGTTDVEEASRAVRGLLLPRLGGSEPGRLPGFGEPAVRVNGDTATLTYAGPGARGFVLTQVPGHALTPPLDADVRGLEIRGTAGRFTPSLGELEWVEGGLVVSLRSRTLSLAELVQIAEHLGPS